MQSRTTAIALTFAIGIAGTINAHADKTADPIVASFERALGHEAAPPVEPTGTEVETDVLYTLVNQPLQSAEDIEKTAVTEVTDDINSTPRSGE